MISLKHVQVKFKQFKYHRIFQFLHYERLIVRVNKKLKIDVMSFVEDGLKIENIPKGKLEKSGISFRAFVWNLNVDHTFKDKLIDLQLSKPDMDISSEDIWRFSKLWTIPILMIIPTIMSIINFINWLHDLL